MNETTLRPYSRPVAYLLKFQWAVGERVLRALLLNRFAPRVAGVERGARYVTGGHRLQSVDVFKPLGSRPSRCWSTTTEAPSTSGTRGPTTASARPSPTRVTCLQRQLPHGPALGVQAAVAGCRGGGEVGVRERRVVRRRRIPPVPGGDSAGASLSSAYAVMAQDEGLRREVGVRECLPMEDPAGDCCSSTGYTIVGRRRSRSSLDQVRHDRLPGA